MRKLTRAVSILLERNPEMFPQDGHPDAGRRQAAQFSDAGLQATQFSYSIVLSFCAPEQDADEASMHVAFEMLRWLKQLVEKKSSRKACCCAAA